jgi:hypothetical protein
MNNNNYLTEKAKPNTRSLIMNYQLINFNIPTRLKTQLDLIAKHKHISRTAIINTQLESYCSSELAYIEASNEPAGSLL